MKTAHPLLLILLAACGRDPIEPTEPDPLEPTTPVQQPPHLTASQGVRSWSIDGLRGELTAASVSVDDGTVRASFWRCTPPVQTLEGAPPIAAPCTHRFAVLEGGSLRTELVDPAWGAHTSLLPGCARCSTGLSGEGITAADTPSASGKRQIFVFRRGAASWERTRFWETTHELSSLVSRRTADSYAMAWAERAPETGAWTLRSAEPARGPIASLTELTLVAPLPASVEPVLGLDGDGAPRAMWTDRDRLYLATPGGALDKLAVEQPPLPARLQEPAAAPTAYLRPLQLVVDGAGHSHLLVARSSGTCQNGCPELLYLHDRSGGWHGESIAAGMYPDPHSVALRVDDAGRAYVALVAFRTTNTTTKMAPVEQALLFGHNRAGAWSFQILEAPDATGAVALAVGEPMKTAPGIAHVGWFGATRFNLSAFPLSN